MIGQVLLRTHLLPFMTVIKANNALMVFDVSDVNPGIKHHGPVVPVASAANRTRLERDQHARACA